MSEHIFRRTLVQSALSLAALPGTFPQPKVARLAGTRVRIDLNSYSFEEPLRDGSMTLSDVARYCIPEMLGQRGTGVVSRAESSFSDTIARALHCWLNPVRVIRL
jgi:hypothetical protein